MSRPLPRAIGGGSTARGSSSDAMRTAKQIMGGPALREAAEVYFRQGEVKAVDVPGQTVDLTLGGQSVVIPGVPHGSNYRPTVGDIVWVFSFGNVLLVFDRIGAFGPSVISTASSAFVDTSQTRSSTSYGDLSTVGPQLTCSVSPSGRLLVQVSCWAESNVAGDGALMGIALSGANVAPADDREAQVVYIGTANSLVAASKVTLITGLNPGNTTVTAKYKSLFGGAAEFTLRHLWVLPL